LRELGTFYFALTESVVCVSGFKKPGQFSASGVEGMKRLSGDGSYSNWFPLPQRRM